MQTVHIDGVAIDFAKGETIHTENSYKYTVAEFERLASCCGFETAQLWTDKDDHFALYCLRGLP